MVLNKSQTSKWWPPSWPYDWNATESRLDPDAIEKHGSFLLSRALNIRRLIAFLGSGTSIPYGRVAWDELATKQVKQILRLVKQQTVKVESGWKGTESLVQQINTIRAEQLVDGDRIMLALQLCEQFWTLASEDDLKALCVSFEILSEYDRLKVRLRQPELGRRLMRAWIGQETFDELPHIKRLLQGDLNMDIAGIARAMDEEAEQVASVQTIFIPPLLGAQRLTKNDPVTGNVSPAATIQPSASPETAQSLVAATDLETVLSGVWDSLVTSHPPRSRREAGSASRIYLQLFQDNNLQKLKSLCENGKTGHAPETTDHKIWEGLVQLCTALSESPVPPTRYYILGLILDLLRLQGQSQPYGPDHSANRSAGKVSAATDVTAQQKVSTPPLPRHKIIPISADILHKIAFKLDISRFLTTNYDLEFERLMHDLGFTVPQETVAAALPGQRDERVGPLGGRTRDSVLTEDTAVDLVDAALDQGDYHLQIMHLHGSSASDELIVTERDYQLKYIRDGRHQQIYREGLELAFGGNPILFVGVGLSEGDVLRPIREFAAGLSRRNHSLIALRPATAEQASLDLFVMQQYARYGIHVIHYGFFGNSADRTRDEFKENCWLSYLLNPNSGIISGLKVAIKEGALETNFKKSDFDVGIISHLKSGWFVSDGGQCNIAPDIMALEATAKIYDELPPEKRKVVKDALLMAIGRASASIIASALSAKIDGIFEDWKSWWDVWRFPLPGREDYLRYYQDDPGVHVFHRHRQKDYVYNPFGTDLAKLGFPEDPAFAEFQRLCRCTPIERNGHSVRRVFIIPGRRGSGKGHLFATFRANAKDLYNNGTYTAQLFIALGFSNEVASIWDQITQFLAGEGQFKSGEPSVDADKASAAAGESPPLAKLRIDSLKRAIEQCGGQPPDYRPRGHDTGLLPLQRDVLKKANDILDDARRLLDDVRHGQPQHPKNVPPDENTANRSSGRRLIVMNAFDNLFERDGSARTAEIGMVMDLLLGEVAAGCDLDIVLLTRTSRIPKLYRQQFDPGDSARSPLGVQIETEKLNARAKLSPDDPSVDEWRRLNACGVVACDPSGELPCNYIVLPPRFAMPAGGGGAACAARSIGQTQHLAGSQGMAGHK